MKHSSLAALGVAIAVAACGGGGDDAASGPAATSEVPASASASPGGFIAYLQELVASAADMLEPVDTSAVAPQVDDTGEPKQVD